MNTIQNINSPAASPMLSPAQIASYRATGYLHLPGIFPEHEVAALRASLDQSIADWSVTAAGWQSAENAAPSSAVIMHRLEYYSAVWDAARRQSELVAAVTNLIGPDVEYIGSSTHTKPAHQGAAFPMHQDSLYYGHEDERLIIAMVHLDDTDDHNGAIRFMPHDLTLRHIAHTKEVDPENGGSYLDPKHYGIDNAEPVYCRAGDVVLFNIFTIHGSPRNESDHDRRAVVFRYRNVHNHQVRGNGGPFSTDRDSFGLMVSGQRPPIDGMCAAVGGNFHKPHPREWYFKEQA